MPLEIGSYISDLVTSNPAASDGLNNADDHMRLIKAAVKNTFPNFNASALSSTQAQIDAITAFLQSGVLRGNGAVPPGQIADFGGTTAPTGWLVCDGGTQLIATYPLLAAYLGTTWGGNGTTTFGIPDFTTASRFRRHRGTLAGAVGNLQSPVNLTHNHSVNGAPSVGSLGTVAVGDHYHAAGIYDPNHAHSIPDGGLAQAGFDNGGTPGLGPNIGYGSRAGNGTNAAATGVRVNSTNGIDTTYSAGSHGHTVNGAPGVGSLGTVASGDANEARPYSATVLTCIKT